jgi:curved DNA-binding protein CbpA
VCAFETFWVMSTNKNFYQTLGLLNDVDDVVIKAAYRALAQKYHPDKYKTNKELHTQKMANLNEAFAAIGTKAKRKAYDESLHVSAAKQEKKKAASDVHSSNDELIEKLEPWMKSWWLLCLKRFSQKAFKLTQVGSIPTALKMANKKRRSVSLS